MNFYKEDDDLRKILKKQLEPSFFVWADRKGQPKLIKFNTKGEDISEVWVNEGCRNTI
ncbi:hypothetical protein [Halobacillus campisalis]|uniref:Pyridoxamine 5'-phosphate oxidase putative domain-containing protein n=1 Tax=Halobacillus campisalis TaxID=435909 RepID=A0ABW2K6I3_9BACI|nr:hypothetical protein [Halobacillus campisalis]